MKVKSLCMTFIGLLGSIATSNAMDGRYLTDGRPGSSSALAPYQKSTSQSASVDVDFSNASQQKLTVTTQLSNGDYVKADMIVQYLGQDRYGLPNFLDYLEHCITSYVPGMKLNAQHEITISDEDILNIEQFGKYAVQNLFFTSFRDNQIASAPFKEFKSKHEKAFDIFHYDDNCLMFALMYYLDKPESTSVEIKNTYYKYNNLTFSFSPCQDKESGKVVPISFKERDLSYDSPAKVDQSSSDTMNRYLSAYMNIYDALYKFSVFKVSENNFRIMVKLSSKQSSSGFYGSGSDNPYEVRKVTNFMLQIKK